MKLSQNTRKILKEALIYTSVASACAYYLTSDSFLNLLVKSTLKLPSVQKKVKFEYEKISGCVFCGKYVVTKANIKNETLDLDVEKLIFQLNIENIYKTLVKDEPLEFDRIILDKAKGNIIQKKNQIKMDKSLLKINDLLVMNSKINFQTSLKQEVNIVIENLKTLSPFESKDLLFNLGFQSNIEARIDGSYFNIQSHPKLFTNWELKEIPISLFKKLNDHDILDFIDQGKVNIVLNSVNVLDNYPIKCKIEFDGLIFDHENPNVKEYLKEIPIKFNFELNNTVSEDDLKTVSKSFIIEKLEESILKEMNRVIKDQFNEKIFNNYKKVKDKVVKYLKV